MCWCLTSQSALLSDSLLQTKSGGRNRCDIFSSADLNGLPIPVSQPIPPPPQRHDRRSNRAVTVCARCVTACRLLSESQSAGEQQRWEMRAVKACVRCVGVLALASGLKPRFMPRGAAGMRRNRRKRHTAVNLSPLPSLLLLLFLLISSPLFLLPLLYAGGSALTLPPSAPRRHVFWTETKGKMCLFMWLGTGRGEAFRPGPA